MKDAWYCVVRDQQVGPISYRDLKQLVEAGELRSTDLIWKEGLPEWLPANEFHGLFTRKAGPPRLPRRTVADQVTQISNGETLHESNNNPRTWVIGNRFWIWSAVAGLSLVCILLAATALKTAEQAKRATEAAIAENLRLQKVLEAQKTQMNAPAPIPIPAPEQRQQNVELTAGLLDLKKKMEAEMQAREKAFEARTVCRSCGGAGNYNYVDSNGNLITRTCPKCFGLGHTRGIFSGGK